MSCELEYFQRLKSVWNININSSTDVQGWALSCFSAAICLHRNGETSMKGSLHVHPRTFCVYIPGPLRWRLITELLLATIGKVVIGFRSHTAVISCIQYIVVFARNLWQIKTAGCAENDLFKLMNLNKEASICWWLTSTQQIFSSGFKTKKLSKLRVILC